MRWSVAFFAAATVAMTASHAASGAELPPYQASVAVIFNGNQTSEDRLGSNAAVSDSDHVGIPGTGNFVAALAGMHGPEAGFPDVPFVVQSAEHAAYALSYARSTGPINISLTSTFYHFQVLSENVTPTLVKMYGNYVIFAKVWGGASALGAFFVSERGTINTPFVDQLRSCGYATDCSGDGFSHTNGVAEFFVKTNTTYTVGLSTHVSARGDSDATRAALAYVDPYFYIDPTTPDLQSYSLNFSENVGNSPPSTGGTVPEPASWALMIGGFGLAGERLRRRRAVAA